MTDLLYIIYSQGLNIKVDVTQNSHCWHPVKIACMLLHKSARVVEYAAAKTI